MTSREEFLQHIWHELIDINLRHDSIDNTIAACTRDSDGAFAGVGPALDRMLASGASRSDLCAFARMVAYETAFGVLHALEEPGVRPSEASMLHEDLLSADPSGLEGRRRQGDGAP